MISPVAVALRLHVRRIAETRAEADASGAQWLGSLLYFYTKVRGYKTISECIQPCAGKWR